MKKASDRTYDVVLWGATGFTGKLVAEYLVRKHGVGKSLKWAIAGRSRDKLESVRQSLVSVDASARDLPVLVGDARDATSLTPMVRAARVVCTTVGPYAVYGRELVAACVEHGTHYCDLTGETQFVRETIDRHHARAAENGTKIVHCCGFDSIPSDLGTLVVQNAARDKLGAMCDEVRFYLTVSTGGLSGGTAASAFNMFEQATHDPALRRLIADPYALDPQRGRSGPDRNDQRGVRWDDAAQTWTGPFVMAAVNTRIVRRSNALMGYAYGKDFRYSEVMGTGPGPAGCVRAAALSFGTGALVATVLFPPTRKLLQATIVPAPGEGPSQQTRENGRFKVQLLGLKGGKVCVRGRVEGQGDPGYSATARMLAEAAVSLATDALEANGGVLTPASAMGMALVERLRGAKMTFEAAVVGGARVATGANGGHAKVVQSARAGALDN